MGQLHIEKNAGGLEGLCVITPTVHPDSRGYFMEIYNQREFEEAGIHMRFVQDNQSMSDRGVLRGMHFQKHYQQTKLVRVTKGAVYDVVIDIRENSPTFGKWFGITLSEDNKKQLLVPRGFAHGFLSLCDGTVFCYKCDDFFHANDEGGIAWNDPRIGIEWPGIKGAYPGSASAEGYRLEDGARLIMSEKDQSFSESVRGLKETKMISFNIPPFVGSEMRYIEEAIQSHKICGDGSFTKRCNEWIEKATGTKKALLTTSCTHATELSALLVDIEPGDEVIMPSFTFVSTADAFVLRGARAVFVDIRPDTMNMDEKLIEDAITPRTKAIVPVHYAGVACEMDTIMDIAKRHHLTVIEDAAQGVMSTYKGKALGAIGDFGCYSFHETKNYSMGEGGALLIQDEAYIEKAEILREKGTNRSKFFRGEIDKYTWVMAGSSYLPSELNAAYLYGQLEQADTIFADRMKTWNHYYEGLKELSEKERIEIPFIPEDCGHNAHMFYIKAKDLEERTALIDYLKARSVHAVFHYIPLHSSPAGLKLGRFHGEDKYTTKDSERLVRLPFYYHMSENDTEKVIEEIKGFYA